MKGPTGEGNSFAVVESRGRCELPSVLEEQKDLVLVHSFFPSQVPKMDSKRNGITMSFLGSRLNERECHVWFRDAELLGHDSIGKVAASRQVQGIPANSW